MLTKTVLVEKHGFTKFGVKDGPLEIQKTLYCAPPYHSLMRFDSYVSIHYIVKIRLR